MANLPEFPNFDTSSHAASLSYTWNKWIKRLENLLTALEITDDARRRALLLHYAGEEVNDIYETLAEKEYASTKAALTTYFQPKKNLTYETGNGEKDSEETINQYVSRLKEAGLWCEFHDLDREIKDQIVVHCKSDTLRRKALGDDPTLPDLVKYE